MSKQVYRPSKADTKPVKPTRDPKTGIAQPAPKSPPAKPVQLNKTTGNSDG
jgi:hypothetical protein